MSDGGSDEDKPRFPRSGTFNTKFAFVKSGEPPADPEAEAEEPRPYLIRSDHWDRENRPTWQTIL